MGIVGTPDNYVAHVVNRLMSTTTKHTLQQLNLDAPEMS